MVASPLSHPVATLMRPTMGVAPEDSVELAARRMRENGSAALPVTDGAMLAGIVTEGSLADALGRGVEPTDSVTAAYDPTGLTIRSYASGSEALRQLEQASTQALIVVDDDNRVLGIVSPSDLVARRLVVNRPALIGGMATPFGVYLTTGNMRAGAGDLALMATGAAMSLMLLVALVITNGFHLLVEHRISIRYLEWIEPLMLFGLFGLAMRLAPLSGIHAAEHKVVHAIERGEELIPEIVKRMPRVHPRCGTNLAAGAFIFLGLSTLTWIQSQELRLIVALLATLFLWRRVGSLAQLWVTTRTPNEKQLQMGIRSGRELLDRYAHARKAVPNLAQRIWYMGILQVMAGGTLCGLLVHGAGRLLGLDWLLE